MSRLPTFPAVLFRSLLVTLIALTPLLVVSPAAARTQQADEAPAENTDGNSDSADSLQTETEAQTEAEGQSEAKAQPETAEPDPRIGRKVIVTVDRAPLRTPKNIVWKAYRGEVFTVSLTNGEWLWISNKRGWLWEKETVDFENAIALLSATIKDKPTAENYDMRGIAHTAHEDYDAAIKDFSKSIRKKRMAGVLNNRGRAYYLKQDYKQAISDFDAAIKINPQHFVALLNRALCRMATDKPDAALADLNRATSLNKEFPEALNNRGVIYLQKNDIRRAIADFSLALKIDANYVEAYGNRAAAQRQLGMFADAKADLETARQKDPLNYKPVNDLAWFYATVPEAELRDAELAVTLATKACEMTRYEDYNTLDTLAAAYALKGDFEKAGQWILTAIELAGEDEAAGLQAHRELIEQERPIVK